MPRIVRRLGSKPTERGSTSGATCPDVLEMDDGDFLIIGKRTLVGELYATHRFGVKIDNDEMVIRLPRQVLIDAKRDIPDE